MSTANQNGPKIPEVIFTRPQQDPALLFPFGYNIAASIVETLLVYLQGIFMTTQELDHNFDYTDTSKIKIVDQGAFPKLELGTDPIIVVERGGIQAMGRGGINSMVSLDWNTGKIVKADLFQCPVMVKIYGSYAHVEQYASLIFFSFKFLTEPLKKFSIFHIGQPAMSNMQTVQRDSKVALYVSSVSATIIKEGAATIESKDHAVLRALAFKGRQVFASGTGERVIIRLS